MSVVLLHGSFGHAAENWIPSVGEAVRQWDLVITPSLPTPQWQSFDAWSGIMDAYRDCGALDATSAVVAHSSAAPFMVRYIAMSGLELSSFITVSGFTKFTSGDADFDNINAAIDVQDDEDFKQVQRQVRRRHSFYADNDPFLPLNSLTDFADKLASEHSLVRGAGHFNASSGYTEFSELVSVLERSSAQD